MKGLSDVIKNSGFFYLSALLSSTHLLPTSLLPHGYKMEDVELPTVIFKEEKKKAKEKMGLSFYQGRNVFPRTLLRK